MDRAHQPVLLEEAIAALMVSPDGVYLDGTFGRGGHSARILDALSPTGTLIGFDQDPAAIEAASELAQRDPRFHFYPVNFQALGDRVEAASLSGILLDLGVSSPQLDEPSRGFSFSHDGPLDMRMNPSEGESAAGWLSRAGESEIAQVLRTLGEERFARRIAAAIVAARNQAPIERTGQLAEIVAAANPRWEHHKHPATRSFQAIRLHVNRELEVLQSVLEQAVGALAPGGRLIVISFHSLEDRIV
ncbi:MAG: 16S rRNA (cytosine(1402)-N(4))-methyltransferase RsmH, partial [Halieaceae bacterium]